MASSKKLFILLGVLFALVLLISSEVAASSEHTEEIGERGKPPIFTPHLPQRHGPITSSPGKFQVAYPGKSSKKGCHYGCCRGYRHGPGCKRCCATAHEAPDAQFEDDLNN